MSESSIVLNELEAAVAGLNAAAHGDTVVICADDTAGVYRQVMAEAKAQGVGSAISDPGEFSVEEG